MRRPSRMMKHLVLILVAVIMPFTTLLPAPGWGQDLESDLEAEFEAAEGQAPPAPEISDDLDLELDGDELAAPESAPAPSELESEIPLEPEVPEPEYVEQPIQETSPVEEVTTGGTESSTPVTITGLDFKGNDNGGTIVIKTSAQTSYTTRAKPGSNQYVIEIQNAILPKKFARPYNTKDFSSAIAMFNAYQSSGSKVVRVVVQLREPIQPAVQVEGNSILVVALNNGNLMVEDSSSTESNTDLPQVESVGTGDVGAISVAEEDKVLQGRTLDEFLTGSMQFYGSPINIEFKDMDIRDAFSFISSESGLNLVLTDEVQGKVTLKLRSIPWDQALIVLMQSKQLGYIRQGNILRIAPLKSIRAETDATKDVIEAQKNLQPLKVKVFPVSYAQAKDLEPQVQGFLSSRGKAKADNRTNSIVINDIPEVIVKVGKLLGTLDTQTPQVMIEGKIVEARETFIQQFGVDWRAAPVSAQSFAVGTGTITENYAGLAQATSQSGMEIGPLVGKLFNWMNVSLKINMFEQEGKIKVLSSPRVVTLNNEKAQIEQTNEIPIFAQTPQASGPAITTVTYKTAKLSLNVTPQITAEGGVILDVAVTREFFGESQSSGGTQARPLNGRQAQTKVLVKNGDTAVIGGIYQSDATETEAGVPYLRKIPLIGRLFASKEVDAQKNELLIFLSPRVLNQDEAFGGTPQEDLETTLE